MPWNGSAPSQTAGRTDGTRTGDDVFAQQAAAPVDIEPTLMDVHATDLKDMINACFKKDGGNTATANLPMGGFTLSNIAAATARTMPAQFAQLQDNKGEYIATVGGTADVITLTPSPVITAYAAGQRFTFIASGDNTTATTVNVSSVGAKSIVRNDGANTALEAGDIQSGQIVDIEYDGTRFQLINWITTIPLSQLNITGGTAETTPAVADEIPLYDASATANRKMTVLNLLKVITLLTAETAPAVDDELAIYDLSGTATDKITLANLFKVINGLTEDTTPHITNDFVVTYDASASAAKKVTFTSIATALGGIPAAASAAEQETGTEAAKYVAPATQHRHASAAKSWVKFNPSAVVAASYNVTSVTDNGQGDWTVNIGTDFSSGDYCGVATAGAVTGCAVAAVAVSVIAQAGGTFRIQAGAGQDPDDDATICAAFFGDQA